MNCMKKTFLLIAAALLSLAAVVVARPALTGTPKGFKGTFHNAEYQVYLTLDFIDNSVTIPGQEVLGEMPGFLGARRDTRKWPIVEVEMKSARVARLVITNDYGSEDLEATLTLNKDGSLTLVQGKGSDIKIVVDRKWLKLPRKLVFK